MYGEGNYGLTAVKEISVTKSFLGLKEEDKKCQNLESLEDCSTKRYLQSIRSDQTSRKTDWFSVGEPGVDLSVLALMKTVRSVLLHSFQPSERWRKQPRTAEFPVREYLPMWRNIPCRNISVRATGISWRITRDTGTSMRLASSSSTISAVSLSFSQ